MADTWVQTRLGRGVPQGIEEQTVWLPSDYRVQVGSVITLKGSRKRWRGMWQGKQRLTSAVLNKRWNVGGL